MTGALPIERVKDVIADPYTELQVPVGSSMDKVVAAFRQVALVRAVAPNGTSAMDLEAFQRQAIAYRFLFSLPIDQGRVYNPDDILAMLRPLDAQGPEEGLERASPLLEVHIASMEQAQRAWQLPYTNYVITVHYCLRKHVVRRRYREFLALHQTLQSKLPVLPALPESSWREKLSMSSERAQALSEYLSRVVRMLANRGLFSMDMMAFLEINYAKVRAEEEAFAMDYLSRQGRGANQYYMIPSPWLATWKRFLVAGNQPPGKIPTHALLDRTTRAPRPFLSAGKHYRCINAHTWEYLERVYGGGPRIVRRSPSLYAEPSLDIMTSAITAQRLVRGFLGRVHARRHRNYLLAQNPIVAARIQRSQSRKQLEDHMARIRKFVEIKESQIRHVAAIKVQRVFRAYLLRAEHRLLMNESAVPTVQENLEHVEDYLPLEEIAMLRNHRLRLAHFVLTMTKGVPLQKTRSRRKAPKWRLFKINDIGSQLVWCSQQHSSSIALVDCIEVSVERPFVLLSSRRPSWGLRKSSVAMSFDQAVVVQYQEDNQTLELILVCESSLEADALCYGLEMLIQETKCRARSGETYVDGHGIIRKKVPHAKLLIRQAKDVLDQHYGATKMRSGSMVSLTGSMLTMVH